MKRWSLTETAIAANMALLAVLSVLIFMQLNEGRADRESAATPAVARYHLVLVYQEEKSAYWSAVKEGARRAAEKDHVEVEFLGPEVTDMVEQADLLNRAIASKVDGIIVQGMNEEAFTPLINKAAERGIPVLTIESDAPESKRVAYVGSDNYAAGTLAGKYIAERLKGRGNVGIVIGNFHASNQRLRLKGIQDVLARYPGIRIVSVVDSEAHPFLAASVTEQLLSRHPELDLVASLSPLDGPGVGQAVQQAGLAQRVDVLAFGFEQMTDLAPYIRDGTVDAVVVEEPYRMGLQAVETMLDVKRGRPVPARIYTGVRLSANKSEAERR